MERATHECEERKPGYLPVEWEGFWRVGPVCLIDHCPYCGLKLEAPAPPDKEIEVSRKILDEYHARLFRAQGYLRDHHIDPALNDILCVMQQIEALLDD